jgi:hypothetical protein
MARYTPPSLPAEPGPVYFGPSHGFVKAHQDYFYVNYTINNRGLPVRQEQALIPCTPMEYLVEFQKRSSYGERIAFFHFWAAVSPKDYDLIKAAEPDCIEVDPFYMENN